MENRLTFNADEYKKEAAEEKLAIAKNSILNIRDILSPSAPLDELQESILTDILNELRSYLYFFENEMAFLEERCQSASSTKNNLKLAVRYLMIALEAKKQRKLDPKNFSDLSNDYYKNLDKCHKALSYGSRTIAFTLNKQKHNYSPPVQENRKTIHYQHSTPTTWTIETQKNREKQKILSEIPPSLAENPSFLYELLSKRGNNLILQEICMSQGISYNYHDSENSSHAAKSMSLTIYFENTKRLSDLACELYKHFPKWFAQDPQM